MKIQITFKDPDGVYEAIQEKAESQLVNAEDEIIEKRMQSIQKQLESWIKYNEYITVEFDTEAKTATVIPNR